MVVSLFCSVWKLLSLLSGACIFFRINAFLIGDVLWSLLKPYLLPLTGGGYLGDLDFAFGDYSIVATGRTRLYKGILYIHIFLCP